LVVSPPISYITTAGVADIAAASPSGPFITITSFKIGSDIIYSDSASTLQALTSVQSGGVNAAVYTMTSSSQLQYSVLSPNEVLYLITLDETVGNFTIGNIGLYTSDGTLFDIVALSNTSTKIATSGTTLGNRRVYECIVNFTNAATISSLTGLVEYAYNLATVATQSALPSPVTPPYNIYLVQNYTVLGITCLAINYNNLWNFVPTQYPQPQIGGAIAVPAGSIASGVAAGDCLYYNASTEKFTFAIPSSGASYFPQFIAGEGNFVYPMGSIYTAQSAIFTAGTQYYCNNTGATGNLSATATTPTAPIGVAITSTCLLLNPYYDNITAAGNLTVQGNTTLSGTVSTGALTVTGNTGITGNAIINGTGYFTGVLSAANGTSGFEVVNYGQFTNGSNSSGSWRKAPDGFINQRGVGTTNGSGGLTVNFPIAFVSTPVVVASVAGTYGSGPGDTVQVSFTANNEFQVASWVGGNNSAPLGPIAFTWIAEGF